MKRTPLLVAALCAAVGLSTGAAGAAPAGTSSPVDLVRRDADAIVADGAPGVVARVDTARGGVEVRSGLGDLAARTPVPRDAHFRFGSFTKTFVATTVLHLVGEGRLSLEDTVDRWLPGVVTGNGHDGRGITVRQLLQHTSGLPDFVVKLPRLFKEDDFLRTRFDTMTAAEGVRLGLSRPPDFEPGRGWSYSNTNYLLAGMVIEAVTGRTWQQEVTARVLRPLGLRDTSAPHTSPFLPHPHAKGYDMFAEKGIDMDPEDPRWGGRVDVTLLNPSIAGAAGAMTGTAADGTRFLRALLGGEVLEPAQLAELKRTVPTPEAGEGTRYGLGVEWRPTPCGGAWSHGGTAHGYLTLNGTTENGERAVVVSVNSRTPWHPDGPPKAVPNTIIDHALCGGR
ncbi:serine hydrolase domain-containing protein [Actinosynnema sp. NPDC023587]|uniref:serine hydrolase domain-containing protein n=1 Tax=Actinosynnema sp. NPDC023587 TaxID=3154695 RepID=UPI0033CAF009